MDLRGTLCWSFARVERARHTEKISSFGADDDGGDDDDDHDVADEYVGRRRWSRRTTMEVTMTTTMKFTTTSFGADDDGGDDD